ncbi:MAG TPA: hypothetical protein VK969_06440 [Acidimicrobiia bacterium]|nr:hypothetical protein [Acidimicrobiia bacterium]
MRHLDYQTTRALQDRQLAEARVVAERREVVRRNRRSLRLGLAAKLGANPKRWSLAIKPKAS